MANGKWQMANGKWQMANGRMDMEGRAQRLAGRAGHGTAKMIPAGSPAVAMPRGESPHMNTGLQVHAPISALHFPAKLKLGKLKAEIILAALFALRSSLSALRSPRFALRFVL